MAHAEPTSAQNPRDPNASDGRYLELVELCPDTILVHEDGVFLYANPAAASLLGVRSAADLLGRPMEGLIAPASRPRIRELLREVRGIRPSRRIVIEDLHLESGDTVDLEVSSAPVVWDGRQARQLVARDITEQKRVEARLLEIQKQLRTLVDHAPEAIVLYDMDSLHFVDLNQNAERLFGLPRRKLLRLGPSDVSPERQPDGRLSEEVARERLEQVLAGRVSVFEWIHLHSSGREIPCEVRLVRLPATDRRLVRGSILDISERKRVEGELRATRERFSKVFHASPVGITVSRLDDGKFVEVNDSFLEMTGYRRSEVVGRRAEELRLWIDRETRRAIDDAVRGNGQYVTVEGRLRTRSGEIRHVLCSFARIEVDGEDCVLALGSDISERKAFEEQLRHLAFHDPLTGLANRVLFEDRLAHALERARSSRETLAVLFLDLDRFKVVNDSLGHTAGDTLLAEVGHRLRKSLPEAHTLARFGGDEFAILLENAVGRESVRRAAHQLLRALEAPFELMGTRVHVTASIGVAFSDGEESPEDLLRYMDIAMYRAKKEKSSEYRVFDRRRDSEATRRLYEENELRQALEEDQLELRFQPIVSLGRGEVRGVEALLRWRHPKRGLVSAPEFVPMAEELGLIERIGDWVLRTACRRAAAWRGLAAPDGPFRLSVNLSARQLQDPDLVDRVEEILSETGYPAEELELELTENAAVQATEQIRRLRSTGVRLALDDFGTGYASLAYLRRLEVDTLKIDQSFVHGCEQGGTDEVLVRSILFLAEQLGLVAIAEGVETAGQAERLRSMRCRWAQGFYFARPLPAEELSELFGETLSLRAGNLRRSRQRAEG